ncbi:MAG: adenine methyltransferase [Lachnospiraceae bacterium]|nr:adenine methyltransferase [Lachnospiraceae bacterium]
MNTDLMFSSKKEDWETPQDLFDELNKEFDFTTDVCASEENHKCDYYFRKDAPIDGLRIAWTGRCWMNPPYGRGIGKWIKKAHDEVKRGVPLVVCLLPARTDTKWFHEYIYNKENVEVRFLKGRLKFGGSKNSAPFPSMVVIFNNIKAEKKE